MSSAVPGQVLTVTASTENGEWYQLENGLWIASFLVDGTEEAVPVK
jgi:hypothetical protein